MPFLTENANFVLALERAGSLCVTLPPVPHLSRCAAVVRDRLSRAVQELLAGSRFVVPDLRACSGTEKQGQARLLLEVSQEVVLCLLQ